jgi:CBS domain-containing protein
MVNVRDLLRTKPDELWTVAPNASVFEALELLAAKDIGALPVVEGGRLVGIFSERDYARKVVLKGRASRDMFVADVMVRTVICVSPKDSINDCMALITERRIRHLPVMEGERLIGIVTIGDVVKQIITEQDHTIEQLERYIRGSY